jgi:peptidoglycan/xylan/chitin deacetylase (PgdA/CDA1 family)
MNSASNNTYASDMHSVHRLLKPSSDVVQQANPNGGINCFLLEEYASTHGKMARSAYYALKPLMPRFLQLALRRRYVEVQKTQVFPAWPIEEVVIARVEAYETTLAEQSPSGMFHRISYWPHGCRFAFAITHDVEWDSGLRHAPALLEIEKRLGFTSSWNLVPERYPIDWKIVDVLREAGNEIGIHGLKHDGRLFQSKRRFFSRLVKIQEYANAWGAAGFRSPSTLRNAEWMTAMEFEYDSSFPDTDPYEPQPGGCCSPWPYFLGNMVELPLTMPQDHTLYEILKHTDLGVWYEKVPWLEKVEGLVLINVHPDYMISDGRLRQYEDFLSWMKEQSGMWNALPKDIAQWWRDRDKSNLVTTGGAWEVEGPAAERASVLRVYTHGNSIVRETIGAPIHNRR